MSVSEYAQTLADYRINNVRASEDVLKKGIFILDNNGLRKLGDDGWAFLEQLAIAALDLGHISIANDCIDRLSSKFPESPRVECLQGMRLESTGAYDDALHMYNIILETDPSNAIIWKRKVSVLRQLGQINAAVDELVKYLDTFYIDPEAWLELADMYSSCALYAQALYSLSHVLLLVPQNSFYVLQSAETAYTARDIPLALKYFLRAMEMVPSTRGWYGVKLCARRLLREAATSASDTAAPSSTNLALLDELATERLLAAYSTTEKGDDQARGGVLKWLQGK